ncbi:MAG: CoA transferase [Beijerinckiaceae bacterium]|nr:CoA transferase [Beijerinckiaceae bacterium]MDO9441941.1 CoA transferase [Beijerinckiaceae bacterium]
MIGAGALDGVKVVEFTSYVSGPYAGMLLGDFGADVVKIEPPKGGDPFRGWGASGYSATFGSVNRNKRSIALDLRTPAGVEAARKLMLDADVVIENLRAGALDRLGLGWDDIREANPRLIYCSITGFGDLGPYAERPGYDTVGQAMGGLLSLLTDMNDPKPMGISLSDHLGGMAAALGILAALNARTKTGRGQRVSTSLLESTISFLAENAARFFENGETPARATRTHIAQVFAFVAGDDRPFVIHLSSPQKFWEGLLAAVARPDLGVDPRFADRKARIAHYDALHAEFSAIFRTQPRDHWLALLEKADVPCGPLYDLKGVFADPQVAALEMVVDVPHPLLGSVSLIRNGVRMSDTPPSIRSAAPQLGQHNDEILAQQKAGA